MAQACPQSEGLGTAVYLNWDLAKLMLKENEGLMFSFSPGT